jgi:hypothetical protein
MTTAAIKALHDALAQARGAIFQRQQTIDELREEIGTHEAWLKDAAIRRDDILAALAALGHPDPNPEPKES